MEMKTHILDLFRHNDAANRKVIAQVAQLPDPAACIRLMSHLVHSQDKWLARLQHAPDANAREWFGPSFAIGRLLPEWERSLGAWVAFMHARDEQELLAPVQWVGFDGGRWEARLCDIALQLNFHGIHHRAQVQTLLRAQGLEPAFIDYIGTVYRKLG
jgi:uncharacterized damage-inducible protein DinB